MISIMLSAKTNVFLGRLLCIPLVYDLQFYLLFKGDEKADSYLP